MALVDLLYRCPCCGADPLVAEGKEAAHCAEGCGRRFALAPGGGRIVVSSAEGSSSVAVSELASRLRTQGGALGTVAEGEAAPLCREARVRLRRAGSETPLHFEGRLLGYFERFGPPTEGRLALRDGELAFYPLAAPEGDDPGAGAGAPIRWPVSSIRALQGSSSSLQVSPAEGGPVLLRFHEDSPRRWEELLEEALRRSWRARGLGEIVEFQPRIRAERRGRPRGPAAAPRGVRRRLEPVSPPMHAAYRILRPPSRWLLRSMARIEVRGREHVPREGPFVLVPNHQSLADPFLVQAFCGRVIHSMTKSTQFGSSLFRWLLPRLHGFPVRRYRVDPQAVRTLLRLLEGGEGVCIYPEGERSWDGELQPFRRGALRVLLYAGVPIVPVGIRGMSDLWPRWLRLPRPRPGRRIPVSLSFGEPIRMDAVRDRSRREELLPELDRLLHERIDALCREPGDSTALGADGSGGRVGSTTSGPTRG